MPKATKNSRLAGFLSDIKKDALEIYGTDSHMVKEVNLGSGEYFEIHYYEDGEEINEAFFISGGARIPLLSEEIKILSQQF